MRLLFSAARTLLRAVVVSTVLSVLATAFARRLGIAPGVLAVVV
jgi:hypothetical protein